MIHPVIKGTLAKILVATCILMQLAVIMPHHHHDNSGMPCVNIFHCTGDHAEKQHHTCACGDRHCDGPVADTHGHDTGGTPCVLSLTDMIRPERERVAGPSEFTVQLFAVQTVIIRTIHDADAATCLNTIIRLDRKRSGIGIANHTEYLVAAIPPRAPSFTV